MIRSDIFLELRIYLNVLRRRWPFVVIPTLIVLVYGILTFRMPPPTYQVTLQYIVSQPPSVSAEIDEESRQYTWITSQYIVNALTDWVARTDFAGRIAQKLDAQNIEIDTLEVFSSIEVDTFRSILEIVFTHPDEETVEAIANAATLVLQESNVEAIPHLGTTQATIEPIDEVLVQTLGAGVSAFLDIPLRLFVAIAAGIGLAFLLEYVDPKIRHRDQLRGFELPLLGEIPRE